MILTPEQRAALLARLATDPAWIAEQARIAARYRMPRRRARKTAEALERFAMRHGHITAEQVKASQERDWMRPLSYDEQGVV